MREEGLSLLEDVEELSLREMDLSPEERHEVLATIVIHEQLGGLDVEKAKMPETIGRYWIRAKLGAGGFGTVYRAEDKYLKRDIALKVLDREGLDGRMIPALQMEARSLAKLSHRGVIEVHDVGTSPDGHDFIAMELVSGLTLHEAIGELREGNPESAEAKRLSSLQARLAALCHIGDAVAHCHRRGVLHRDIKPGNIRFDSEGHPRLLDFGLAHQHGVALTRGPLIASENYIAPELWDGGYLGDDPRADQFAFAVLCAETLTLDHPPFKSDGWSGTRSGRSGCSSAATPASSWSSWAGKPSRCVSRSASSCRLAHLQSLRGGLVLRVGAAALLVGVAKVRRPSRVGGSPVGSLGQQAVDCHVAGQGNDHCDDSSPIEFESPFGLRLHDRTPSLWGQQDSELSLLSSGREGRPSLFRGT